MAKENSKKQQLSFEQLKLIKKSQAITEKANKKIKVTTKVKKNSK